MLTFMKKDLLVFWRDRRELVLAIFLPIVLIIVLNFAFSNMFGSESNPVSLTLAMVNEDDEAQGMAQFEEKVSAMALPAEEKEMLIAQAAQIAPISFIEQHFQSPDLSQWLTVYPLNESQARQRMEQGDMNGMLQIPSGYTFDILNAIILSEGAAAKLPFIVKENTMETSVLTDVIRSFFDELNFQYALFHVREGEAMPGEVASVEGGKEMMEGAVPFTMGQYFTIAMAVLFALFLAVTIAEKTGAEKREQVYHRLMITNVRPYSYLIGKLCSSFLLAWTQLLLIVIAANLMLGVFSGRSFTFWLGMLLVMLFYTIFTASLSALYTSVMLRLKSIDTANGIFMLVTMVFGTVGGSFVPIYVFPAWLQRIGEWSPNGLTLSVMTEWLQFEQFTSLWLSFIVLGIVSAVCLFAGVALYPRRGEV